MGVLQQQVEWCAAVLGVQGQCVPVFTGPALGLHHELHTRSACQGQQISLTRELFRAYPAPQGGHAENNNDDQRNTCGVGT